VFVFQEGALFPWLTILKNVSLALNFIEDGAQRLKKARHYLELVSLEAFEDYYPHMLSGGMRQRGGDCAGAHLPPNPRYSWSTSPSRAWTI